MVKKGKLIEKYIAEYAGYGKNIAKTGSFLKKNSNPKVVNTLTTLVNFNKVVVEVYEIDEEDENTDL